MDIDRFIERWSGSGGAERANYGLFLTDLCRVLGVPEPDKAKRRRERPSRFISRLKSKRRMDHDKHQALKVNNISA